MITEMTKVSINRLLNYGLSLGTIELSYLKHTWKQNCYLVCPPKSVPMIPRLSEPSGLKLISFYLSGLLRM